MKATGPVSSPADSETNPMPKTGAMEPCGGGDWKRASASPTDNQISPAAGLRKLASRWLALGTVHRRNADRATTDSVRIEQSISAWYLHALAVELLEELTKGTMERRDFGWAVNQLKAGNRVTREGWNGKGMYLWLLPAANVKAEWCREEHLKAVANANGGSIECLGSIRMMTADKKVLTGWLASQTDILSEDWTLVS